MFDEELRFFIENQDELVAKYRGRVLAIRGREVIGDYGSALDAYLQTRVRFASGSFMIQPCEPGPDAYTVTVTSLNLAERLN